MNVAPGCMLIATPLLGDPNFFRTVIVMLDHGDHGSAGVVVNRSGSESVASLIPILADVAGPDAVLGLGGPVEPNGVLGVTVDDSGDVAPADLDDIVSGRPLRLFRGYAGWSPGQLPAEIDEGAWWVVAGSVDDAFSHDGDLWHTMVGRFEDRRSWYRHLPDDPRVN